MTRLRLQAPEDDDPTAHMVSGPSSSVPPSMRPSPTPSQIELSKVRCLAAGRSLQPCCLACESRPGNQRCRQPYMRVFSILGKTIPCLSVYSAILGEHTTC